MILATSDAWLKSHLSHQPSKPGYYIVDCWIYSVHFLLDDIGKEHKHFKDFKDSSLE